MSDISKHPSSSDNSQDAETPRRFLKNAAFAAMAGSIPAAVVVN
jgi:hypothetical protein